MRSKISTGWSKRSSSAAAASKGSKRTLFGTLRVRAMREQSWRPFSPSGKTTTYTYDTMDRLLTRKDGLNRAESYEYDKARNLAKFTDRKNQVATFAHDSLNRRTSATYPDASVTFAY